MKIEAVTICIDYGEFLAEVAHLNIPHLHRWIIVTAHHDKETQSVCRRHGLECVLTDEHKRDGEFSKGRLIEKGMSLMEGSDWILHLDGDIALPTDFKQVLADAHLDTNKIYGCDRLNVTGCEAWDRVRHRGLLCRDNHWMVNLSRPDCTIGARVANRGHGYAPIGFFQLAHGEKLHSQSGPVRRYPTQHGTAARTDVAFAQLWDRRHRELIPELIVWHLESHASPMGENWKGRKSPPFRKHHKHPDGKGGYC